MLFCCKHSATHNTAGIVQQLQDAKPKTIYCIVMIIKATMRTLHTMATNKINNNNIKVNDNYAINMSNCKSVYVSSESKSELSLS